MKVVEQTIFYSLLRSGQWDIHAPIWKYEHTAINYCNKEAQDYSWTETPISGKEFKPRVFEVVEVDVSKLKVIHSAESKDLRKPKKCRIPNCDLPGCRKMAKGWLCTEHLEEYIGNG